MGLKGRRDTWNGLFAQVSPRFAAFACLGEDFGHWQHWPPLAFYNHMAERHGVVTGSGHPVRFVEALPKPRGRRRRDSQAGLPYEQRIWQKGEVSTRPETWHDFFNMFAWCLFPRIKAALNARQAEQRTKTRNAEQNLLCMLDEGGVFAVLGHSREPLGSIYFGHALHEAVMRQERGSDGLLIELVIPDWQGVTKAGLDQVDKIVAELILAQRLVRPALSSPGVDVP